MRGGGSRSREVELQRVAELEAEVRDLGQVGYERAVDLDSVDERDASGEVAGEHAKARADLQHDVVRVQLGEPADDAEDVLVDEEMLAELLLRADAHGPKSAVAFASICASSSPGSSPRAAASAATVCMT